MRNKNISMTETTLNKVDWSYEDSVVCPAGQFTEFANVKVEDENIWAFGYGDKLQGVDDRGLYKVVLATSGGTSIAGKVRFKTRDRASLRPAVGQAPRTSILATGKRVGLKDVGMASKWGKFLVLEFEPDADATIDMTHANTELEVPVTQYQSPDFI